MSHDPLFEHTMQSVDLLLGEEIDARESLEYKALKALDPSCPICFKKPDECPHCDWCIDLGHLCESCEMTEPLEGEYQDDYDARMAGVSRYGAL